MKRKNFLLPLFILFSLTAKGQFDILQSQAYEVFKNEAGYPYLPSTNNVNGLLTSQNANDGFWTDINYADVVAGDSLDWEPIKHLKRLALLSEVSAYFDELENDLNYTEDTLHARIELGLQYWYDLSINNDCDTIAIDCDCATICPCSDNWYYNHIGKQEQLQIIGVLMYEYFSENNPVLLQQIINDFPENLENCHDWNSNLYTGSNRTDVSASMLVRGILSEDVAVLNAGKAGIEGALVVGSATNNFEGIQVDYSFHQHGPLLYVGGYGQTLVETVSKWGAIVRGTSSDFEQSNKDLLINFVLEGHRWTTIGETNDYSANGRGLSRKSPNSSYNSALESIYLDWVIDLAQNTPAEAELIEMANNASTGSFQNLLGSKHFWKSDYVCQYESDYYSSVKMCSGRTYGTESLNHENKLGYWIPFGCTYIYRTGEEYVNIFPLWDWTKIPGVTCPDTIPHFDNGSTLTSTQAPLFVGAADNGRYAVTTMIYDKPYGNDSISAKKAWFHFGDEMIALGAEITSTNQSQDIFTTINQTHFSNEVLIDSVSVGGNMNAQLYANTSWMHHDGIAYFFPGGQDVYLSTKEETKNWNLIGKRTEAVTGEVFTTWINHGSGVTDSTYQYVVIPNLSSTETAIYADSSPVTILHNNSTTQAVKKEAAGLAGVVFYPGTTPDWVQVSNNVRLKTNQPCALLYDGSASQVCISSPDRSQSSITLSYEIYNDDNVLLIQDDVTFALPGDEAEGTSTCEYLVKVPGNVASHCGTGGVAGVQFPPSETYTDVNGDYGFPIGVSDFLNGANHVIDPSKKNNTINGISSFDLVLISKHILGIQELDSPYKIIAADVNKSGSVTTLDQAEIRKLLLFINTEFPDVDSWEFVEDDYEFSDPQNPFGTMNNPWPFPQTINLNLGAGELNSGNDFKAIKMGDVSCNAFNEMEDPILGGVNILLEDLILSKDDIFTLAIRVENFQNMEAYQFALGFDPQKLEYVASYQGDLSNGAKADNFGLSELNQGIIRTLWLANDASNQSYLNTQKSLADTSSLFQLKFKALDDITALSEIIKLDQKSLPAKAWSDGSEHKINLTYLPQRFSLKIKINEEEGFSKKVEVLR